MKKLIKIIALIAAAAAAAALSSCMGYVSPQKFEWEPTHYTMEEILAKAYESPEQVMRRRKDLEEDIPWDSADSVARYNHILGYLENVLHENYKIDWLSRRDDQDGNTFVSMYVILDGYDEKSSNWMFYNGQSGELESTIELFHINENIFKDLNSEIGAILPGTVADYADHSRSGGFNGVYYRPSYITTYNWEEYFADRTDVTFGAVVFFLPEGSTREDGEKLYSDKSFKKIVKKYRLVNFKIADSTGGDEWCLSYEK